MRVKHWCVVAGLLVLASIMMFLVTQESGAAAPADKAPATLEGLLKQGDFDYTQKDGKFKVIVSYKGETTLVVASEESLGNDPGLRVAYLYCPVLEIPDGKKPTEAMLKKMAQLNDGMLVGKLSLNENYVLYCSSFWLTNADSETLGKELALAHMIRKAANKELAPFVEE